MHTYSAPLTTKKQKTTYERSLNYTLRKTYDLLLSNGVKNSIKSHSAKVKHFNEIYDVKVKILWEGHKKNSLCFDVTK